MNIANFLRTAVLKNYFLSTSASVLNGFFRTTSFWEATFQNSFLKASSLKLSSLYKLIWRAFCLLLLKKNPSEFLVEQQVKSNEERAKSNEQRAKSNEQLAKSNEQRARSKQQRATSKKFSLPILVLEFEHE